MMLRYPLARLPGDHFGAAMYDEIAVRREAGFSVRRIAKKAHVDRNTVRRLLREAGCDPTPPSLMGPPRWPSPSQRRYDRSSASRTTCRSWRSSGASEKWAIPAARTPSTSWFGGCATWSFRGSSASRAFPESSPKSTSATCGAATTTAPTRSSTF